MNKSSKIIVSRGLLERLLFSTPFTVVAPFTLWEALQGSEDALYGFLLFVGPFALLGWSLAMYNIQLTEDDVTVNTLFGRFRIIWDDVEKILIDNARIALVGKNKRVVLSPGLGWKNVPEMVELINQKLEQKNMKSERVPRVARMHRNSRVWR